MKVALVQKYPALSLAWVSSPGWQHTCRFYQQKLAVPICHSSNQVHMLGYVEEEGDNKPLIKHILSIVERAS